MLVIASRDHELGPERLSCGETPQPALETSALPRKRRVKESYMSRRIPSRMNNPFGALWLGLATITLTACAPHDPTDEAMLRNFHEHRAEFEKLREMISQDRGLRRVDCDWTDPVIRRRLEFRLSAWPIIAPFLGACDSPRIPGLRRSLGNQIHRPCLKDWPSRTRKKLRLVRVRAGRVGQKHRRISYRRNPPDNQDYLEEKAPTFQKHWDVYRKIEGNCT